MDLSLFCSCVLYGPKKRSPLKWMRCDSALVIQTSVAQEISPTYLAMSLRFRKAVTNNQARFGILEEVGEFIPTFSIHRAMTGHCFDKKQPALGNVVDDDIGHLAVFVNDDSQVLERVRIEVGPFFAGVTDVNYLAARGKPRANSSTTARMSRLWFPGVRYNSLPSASWSGTLFISRSRA